LAFEKVISSRSVFKGRAVNLRVDTVEEPDGRRTTREVVEHTEVICVVAVDGDGKFVLVRQYREAIGKDLLEIPAGGIEAGEDPAEAVRREMAEETGFEPRKLERMGGFYSAPGFCTEYLHLFLATDLVPHRLEAEDTAGIEVVRVRPDEVPGLIESGAICDSKSIAGLLTYLGRKAYCE